MIIGSEECMSGCRGGGVLGALWWLLLMRWLGSCTSCLEGMSLTGARIGVDLEKA